MKTSFSSFYEYPDCPDEAWTKALLCLDTNVLLDLYAYSVDSRNRFLQVLEAFGDRRVIPKQIAIEYHRNLSQRMEFQQTYFKTKELLTALKNQKSALSRKKQHPFLDIRKLEKLLGETIDAASKIWSQAETPSQKYAQQCNELSERIAGLFDKKLLSGFRPDELPEILEQARARFEMKIPPGFADSDKPNNRFGDVVLWLELLKKLKRPAGTTLFFVTSDGKEDWWIQREGMRPAPHPELIAEMKEHEIDFYLFKPEEFVKNAIKHLKLEIPDSDIKPLIEEMARLEEEKHFESARYEDLIIPATLNELSGESLYWTPDLLSEIQCRVILEKFLTRLKKIVDFYKRDELVGNTELDWITFLWQKNQISFEDRTEFYRALEALTKGASGELKILKSYPALAKTDSKLAFLNSLVDAWNEIL